MMGGRLVDEGEVSPEPLTHCWNIYELAKWCFANSYPLACADSHYRAFSSPFQWMLPLFSLHVKKNLKKMLQRTFLSLRIELCYWETCTCYYSGDLHLYILCCVIYSKNKRVNLLVNSPLVPSSSSSPVMTTRFCWKLQYMLLSH